jgi:hypothetical protein
MKYIVSNSMELSSGHSGTELQALTCRICEVKKFTKIARGNVL